jgi:hypothetical protein
LDQAWDAYDVNLPDYITEEQKLQRKNQKGRWNSVKSLVTAFCQRFLF